MPPRRRPGFPPGIIIPIPVPPGGRPGPGPGRPPTPPAPPGPPARPPNEGMPKTMAEAEKELGKCEDHRTNLTLREGKVLVAIHDLKLFEQKGYKRFEDWLEQEGPWSPEYTAKV